MQHAGLGSGTQQRPTLQARSVQSHAPSMHVQVLQSEGHVVVDVHPGNGSQERPIRSGVASIPPPSFPPTSPPSATPPQPCKRTVPPPARAMRTHTRFHEKRMSPRKARLVPRADRGSRGRDSPPGCVRMCRRWVTESPRVSPFGVPSGPRDAAPVVAKNSCGSHAALE
jgi:hypothetical protein